MTSTCSGGCGPRIQRRLIAYGRKTCFETSRDRGGAFGEDPNMFFDKIVNGLICKENWFALAPPRLTPVAARCG